MIASEIWPKTVEEAVNSFTDKAGNMPIIGYYIRVSTDIQVDEGYSLGTQAERLREDAELRYPEGCHLIFIADEGLSGTLPFYKPGLKRGQYRPGLTLLKDLMDIGLVSAVGVYKCNRLTRKLLTWLELSEDYFEEKGIIFFSVAEGLDNTDPSSKMLLHVIMSGAEFERDQIAAVSADGIRKRREECFYIGSGAYGWHWQDERYLAKGQRVNIEPVREELEVVKRIYGWFLAGKKISWIARELDNEGVATPRGAPCWVRRTVREILANPVHAGLVRTSEGALTEGIHYEQRIMDRNEFEAIQEETRRRRETRERNRPPDGKLPEDLLRCGLCGHAMGMRLFAGNPKYYCKGNRPAHEHPSFSVHVDDVEGICFDLMVKSLGNAKLVSAAVDRIIKQMDFCENELRRTKRRLSDALKANENEICRWAERLSDEEYDPQEVQSRLDDLTNERKSLQTELERNNKDAKRRKSRDRKCKAAIRAVQQSSIIWSKMRVEERKELASHLVESLTCEPISDGAELVASVISDGGEALRFQLPRRRTSVNSIRSAGQESRRH